MHITIWDHEALPVKKIKGKLVLWKHYQINGDVNAVSIPKIIEQNSNSLRSRYLSFVFELGESKIFEKRLTEHFEIHTNFNYWWMTLVSEKCNFAKSPYITDAIRIFALDDWSKSKSIEKIRLFTSNKILAKCIKNWSETKGIPFECTIKTKIFRSIQLKKRLFFLLPSTLRGIGWLIFFLSENWSLRGQGLNEWRRSKGRITFVTYLFNLDSESRNKGEFKSPFWTTLPKKLNQERVKSNWLHLYVKDKELPNSKEAAKAIHKFNENVFQTHVTLASFLSSSVIIKTISDWVTLRKKSKRLSAEVCKLPTIKILWPLFIKDWKNSILGQVAISNLLYYNLFKSAFEMLSTQEKGVYLQENQGWELGLCQAWRNNGHRELIGFPHATIPYWDLRYFFDNRTYKKDRSIIPRPDKVACNGKNALEKYKKGGYPVPELIEVEAVRYLYLNEIKKKKRVMMPSGKRRLLVVGDYLESNTLKQLKLLEMAVTGINEGTQITIKPHPGCPLPLKRYTKSKMRIETKPLEELLYKYDLVYASITTSAAVDAYCSGLPVITFIDGSALNLSPLRECDGVSYVSKPEELATLINTLDINPCNVINGKDYFYLDSDLPKWKNVLLGDFSI